MANRLKNIDITTNTTGKRHYRQIKFPEIPEDSSDLYIITTEGDRLDLIANHFYRDTSLWWVIVQANVGILKGDEVALKGGIQLRIPSTPEIIIRNFEKINNRRSI